MSSLLLHFICILSSSPTLNISGISVKARTFVIVVSGVSVAETVTTFPVLVSASEISGAGVSYSICTTSVLDALFFGVSIESVEEASGELVDVFTSSDEVESVIEIFSSDEVADDAFVESEIISEVVDTSAEELSIRIF